MNIEYCFDQYDYTDTSTDSVEGAKERFQDWAGLIEVQKRDIEEDPFEPGFEAGLYALVTASFVLHASFNLMRALRHVRQLLRPAGKVFFGEVIGSFFPNDLLLGTLPDIAHLQTNYLANKLRNFLESWPSEDPERARGSLSDVQ